jgi:hypothetical protein
VSKKELSPAAMELTAAIKMTFESQELCQLIGTATGQHGVILITISEDGSVRMTSGAREENIRAQRVSQAISDHFEANMRGILDKVKASIG